MAEKFVEMTNRRQKLGESENLQKITFTVKCVMQVTNGIICGKQRIGADGLKRQ